MIRKPLAALAPLAQPGREVAVRVTPRARRDAVELRGDAIRLSVTAPPEAGKANEAALALLAQALGLPKSRLALVRGAASRDKVFRVLPP